MRIRNILLASSALVAAAAFASTASAQNVSVQNNQNNSGSVTSSVTIAPITVGTILDSDSVAIGNLIQVSATIGQGIGEVGSNQGGTNSPQINTGSINATTSLTGTTGAAGSIADISTTAAANVININAVVAQNAGNRVLGQNNSGGVSADTDLSSGISFGTLAANSTAMGNLVSATGSSSVGLGAGQNGGGIFTQTNTGTIQSSVDFNGFNAGGANNLTMQATSVGNAVNVAAPVVGVSLTQNNGGGGQYATVNTAFDGGAGASFIAGSSALGNVLAPTGGSFASTSGVFQNNSAPQVATTNINGLATFNTAAVINASATAVGNAIQINQTGSAGFSGAQVNTGPQTATLNFRGTNLDAAASVTGTATAVGNLISFDLGNGNVGSAPSQSNGAAVTAVTNVNGGWFGPLSNFSSTSIGNALQASTLGSVQDFNTGSNQSNFGPVVARTNILGNAFRGGVNVGATAVGNLTSVRIGN